MTTSTKKRKRSEFSDLFQSRITRLLFQDEAFASNVVFRAKTLLENPVHEWVAKTIRNAHVAQGAHPSQEFVRREFQKARSLGTIRKEDAPAYEKFIDRLNKPVPEKQYVKKEVNDFLQNQIIKKFLIDAVDSHLPKRNFAEVKRQMLDIVDFDASGDHSIGTRPGLSFEKRIKKRAKQVMDGVPSGITELDRLMVRGGVTPGQLAVAIAPTGRGKTNWLINLAKAAVLEGFPVVYYTLELDEESISTRMDAAFTDIPINLLRTNVAEVRKSWKKIASVVSHNLVVKGFPTGSASVADLKAHLRQLGRHGFYPKLVIIDYIDLMQPRVTFSDSSYETQGQVYIDVRGLMGEVRAACWSATQGNRSSMDPENDGDIDLHHMAESIKKAFVADVVAGIAQSAKEKKLNRARAVLLKNRNGPAWREIKLKVDHSRATFKALITK